MGAFEDYITKPLSAGFSLGAASFIVNNDHWNEALELARSGERRLAARSAWALSAALKDNKSKRTEFTSVLISDYICSANQSVLREYGKIIATALSKDNYIPDDRQKHVMVEKCLDIMIDPLIPPAPRIWAMEILMNFRDENLVRENYRFLLLDILAASSMPSLLNKSKKLLKRLEAEK